MKKMKIDSVETVIEKHKKYKDFKNLYEEYRKNLGTSTMSDDERTEKIKTFLPSHKSGYDEGYAYYVFSLKDNKTIRFQDVKNSFWATTNEREISKGEILENTHKSHRHIIAHLLHGVFSIFGRNKEYRENLYEKSCFLRIGRAFKDEKNGTFWWVVQSIFPINYDEEKNVLSYLSSIFIEDRYKNSVPFVNIVPNDISKTPVNEGLLREFQKHKYTILDLANFTPTHKQIICIIFEKVRHKELNELGTTADEIANEFKNKGRNTKVSTIYAHNAEILEKGKYIFPLNRFRNVVEFVKFLQMSEFIDENYSKYLERTT